MLGTTATSAAGNLLEISSPPADTTLQLQSADFAMQMAIHMLQKSSYRALLDARVKAAADHLADNTFLGTGSGVCQKVGDYNVGVTVGSDHIIFMPLQDNDQFVFSLKFNNAASSDVFTAPAGSTTNGGAVDDAHILFTIKLGASA